MEGQVCIVRRRFAADRDSLKEACGSLERMRGSGLAARFGLGRPVRRIALLLVASCMVMTLMGCAANGDGVVGGGPAVAADGDIATRGEAMHLPFAIEGVASDADVVEVVGCAEEASLEDAWLFGGDFADIGSFPLDGETVFGSHSDDVDDVASYGAALVGENGVVMLERPSDDPLRYYEPQGRLGRCEAGGVAIVSDGGGLPDARRRLADSSVGC